jgi:hypothetical protein
VETMDTANVFTIEESAAGAWTTLTDVMEQEIESKQAKVVGYPRILESIAFIGDDALHDRKLTIRAGNQIVATVRNTDLTDLDYSEDLQSVDAEIPAGVPVSMTVSDVSATNKYVVVAKFAVHPIHKARQMQRALGGRSRRGRRF